MPSSFFLGLARFAGLDDPGLRDELRARTGGEDEVDSILRSLARFGTDGSIREFHVTPAPARAHSRAARQVTWTVRAVRV